jgi:hypothetical protein
VDILQGLTDLLGPHSRSNIGIKRMGELDEKPFVLSCKQRYGEDARFKAAEFVSMWLINCVNQSLQDISRWRMANCQH